ncbi:hypothetical protein [Vibrio phage VP4B]|uniref:Uncharacterized protein n=1 Tax=Vibrio phage VP4B TaxID=1262540 RepID=V9M036_9CAUD|nr:hypothetical protein FDJ61_gp201 [Vibrio phage VP4B]AGB07315.1 hypothetical protein [Vibrio phage VP4B]
MSCNKEFCFIELKAFLEKEIALLNEPSKHTRVHELYEEYSVPFGKRLLAYLKTTNIDSRYLHDAYGLDFRKNDEGGWEVLLNEMVCELLHFKDSGRVVLDLKPKV